MRNAILGTLAGLAIGTVGALAYSHFLGDGRLADLQAQLDAANAKLTKIAQEKQSLAKETTGESDQVDQLASSNANLRKQLDELKNASPVTPAPAPPLNPMTLADMMRGMFRGGFQNQQQLFLLQARLHLTPDQAAAVKAAIEADAKTRRDIGRQLFQGGKVDPQLAASANTLDSTLAKVLTSNQMAAYQQVQTEVKTARADTMATTQMNQVAPLLQLSDSQKDQVFNAIYQVQIAAPDPMSVMTSPNAASMMTTQAQAVQAAMAKVLTPDQMTLYQQQAQMVPTFGRGGGGGGNGGAAASSNSAGGTATASGGTMTSGYVAPPATTTPPPSVPVTGSSSTTNAETNNVSAAPATGSSSTTNSATTNAAPGP